jgi:ATPase subunit of ABC transporter with duplicated ATPase domains
MNLVDWLRQYSQEKDETFIRGFLGRMLFSGEETQKSDNVLSGGEKVRCLMSKMMLEEGNVLVMDEPTSHLDLEAITKLNESLIEFGGHILFTSSDHQFVQTVWRKSIFQLETRHIRKQQSSYSTYGEWRIQSIRIMWNGILLKTNK